MSTRPRATRYGLARILSKRGLCSRSEAERWIAAGRVQVAGRVVLDPEQPFALDVAGVVVAGAAPAPASHRYLALHKPRGLVTSARDEQGRDTVYRCFEGADLGWIAPVGRLDKASEGLLLFTSDAAWAARIADPATGPSKRYHVHVDVLPDERLLASLVAGIDDAGERLSATSVRLLRTGTRNAWLEVVLDEGRNRQIRRLLAAHGVGVLRLLRVAIGDLALGTLAKGAWRALAPDEVTGLAPPSDPATG